MFLLSCALLTLQILGLEICADIMVGDEMRRGISGGQRKRVTVGKSTLEYYAHADKYFFIQR